LIFGAEGCGFASFLLPAAIFSFPFQPEKKFFPVPRNFDFFFMLYDVNTIFYQKSIFRQAESTFFVEKTKNKN